MPEKSIAEKLMIKPGQSLLVVNAPQDFIESKLTAHLPEEVRLEENKAKGDVDVIQLFVKSKKELEDKLPKLKKQLKPDGKLWVTYPKGASEMKCDVNRDSIREYAPSVGLEAVAIFSVDENWSALRLKNAE
jgi:hypothetical protein